MPGSAVEHAFEALRGVVRSVGDDDHPGVDRVADPDTAAVMDADPRRARGSVEERVEDRPVGDRVRAVAHRLGLAVRRGDRARVEVIPADHHRRRHRTGANERVDRKARLGPIAVAEPADPRRKPLERDPLGRHLEPPLQELVVREELPQLAVDRRDVRRIAGERGPAEGPDPAAEERSDIGRDESRVCEGVTQARSIGLTSQVVSIIENVAPHPDELDHRTDVRHDRLRREPEVLLRVALPQRRRLLERHLGRHVAGEGVVGRGLVGDEIERTPRARRALADVGGVRAEADGERPACRRGGTNPRECVVQRVRLLVEVPRLEPAVDRALVDLDAEDRGPGHRRGQRLRAAHATEAGCQHGPPGEVGRAEVRLARSAERLVRPLQDPLGADVDPRAGGHLTEHRQPLGLETAELVPRGPRGDEEGVRDQHARRVGMRPEHPDGLARLDEERLAVAEAEERPHDVAQRLVRPGGATGSAVDDERLGMLGHLGIEVVEEHPKRSLRLPRPCVQRAAARRPYRREVADELLDHRLAHDGLLPLLVGDAAWAFRDSRCRNLNQLQPVATTKYAERDEERLEKIAARDRPRR